MVPFLALLLTVSGPIGADDIAPADGLGLQPPPVSSRSADLPRSRPSVPWSIPVGGAVATATAAAAVAARRRRTDPVYVVVHGDGGSPADFDGLLFHMGVSPDQVVAFDYRSAHPGADSTEASRSASTHAAAAALDRLVRDTARTNGAVYTIHHSRGGAVGVEMIAALDDGTRPPIDGYIGAALLDPAIGSGRVGTLQRLGRRFGFIPDNGGFDPIRCSDGCRDIREHLGKQAGVEVIAIRNPDAVVTNFLDRPEGLRTYDLVDDGGPNALSYWWNPLAAISRVSTAHRSVLEHGAVADCVRSESRSPGSCEWTGSPRPLAPMWGRGGGINNVR